MSIFSVILPTFNNKFEIINCLKSLNNQTFKDFEVIICVDGSTDNTIEAIEIENFNFNYKILQHPDKQNHGRPSTRNLGIFNAQTEYTLLLDSDNEADVNLLFEHYKILSKHECISVGDIIYKQSDDWSNYLYARGKGKYKHLDEIPFQYLNTQNVAIKTQYLKEVGGLDANITGYGGDDTELSYRLYKRFNLPTIYNKKALANGSLNKTFNKALNQMYEFGNTSLKYIHKKHPNFTEIFNIKLIENKAINIFLANPIFYYFINKTYSSFPLKIKNLLIHYMVFYKICKGYNG
ncbi:MAG: hypothetical protein RLZZ175_863 [Bacteroidota bacterium]|jgi:glycosyltransferase involved in cell wall biosynthesis